MSEFSELIKHLYRVRSYVRDFYLPSWRVRGDYDAKSDHTYDIERRRVESLFNKHYREGYIPGMGGKGKKQVYIAINAANISRNPLYEVWRAKRFRPADIMLHFTILDVAVWAKDRAKNPGGFTKKDISNRVSNIVYMDNFLWNKDIPSNSTIQNKLNEYEEIGLLTADKSGKDNIYFLAALTCEGLPEKLQPAIDFFSEAVPFGELGDHIRDEWQTLCNKGEWVNVFRFKHHPIAQTLDDEVLYNLLTAIKERREVMLFIDKKQWPEEMECVIPFKILDSVQSGYRYVGITRLHNGNSAAVMLDDISKAELREVVSDYEYDARLKKFEVDIEGAWGVSFGADMGPKPGKPEKVVMTLQIDEKKEKYVLDKLEREGRKGKIERLAKNVFSYTSEVWESSECLLL